MDRLQQEVKLLHIWAPEKKFRSKCHIKVGIFILFFVNARNLTKSEFQRRESYQYPGIRIKLPKRGKRGKVQVAPDSSTATFTTEEREVTQKCGAWTSSIGIWGKLIRDAGFQLPFHSCWIRICAWPDFRVTPRLLLWTLLEIFFGPLFFFFLRKPIYVIFFEIGSICLQIRTTWGIS